MKQTHLFAVVVLCASPAWALRYMGPPTPEGSAGQFGLGFDRSYSQFDIISDEASGRAKMDNEVYFARLLFGVTDWAEISGSIGISDIDQDTNAGYQSGNDFSWGVGSKLKFWESGSLELGAGFQLTSLWADDETATGPFLTKGKFDAYLMELAVGPTYKAHGVCVYGGPFVHFITGDLEGKNAGLNAEVDVQEEESEFGGYIGASAEIVKNTSASLEYHFTDDSYAIAVGLVHRFGAPDRTRSDAKGKKRSLWPIFEGKRESNPAESIKSPREKLKTDAVGKPVKDEKGNFMFTQVKEETQEK